MRKLLILLLLALPCAVFHASTAQELLDKALADYKLQTDGTRPWYLVAEIQLYDETGKPTDSGTVERYFISPQKIKTTYTFPNFKKTVLDLQERWQEGSRDSVPFYVEQLLQYALTPKPDTFLTNGTTPVLYKKKMGAIQVSCVMFARQLKTFGITPEGLFPTYCIDDAAQKLRAFGSMGGTFIVYNQLGSFLGSTIPTKLSFVDNGKLAASFTVKQLTTFDPQKDESLFTPSANAEKNSGLPTKVGGGVMAGKILKKVQPVYPVSSRQAHEEGTVVLHAIIDETGHIRQLHLISTPSADLAYSAAEAVRHWTYSPYLFDGVAVQVETTITVNYHIGG